MPLFLVLSYLEDQFQQSLYKPEPSHTCCLLHACQCLPVACADVGQIKDKQFMWRYGTGWDDDADVEPSPLGPAQACTALLARTAARTVTVAKPGTPSCPVPEPAQVASTWKQCR